MPKNMITCRLRIVLLLVFAVTAGRAQTSKPPHAIVLHAARLLEVENGRVLSPVEVLVEGERIAEVGKTVKHSAGEEIIDLGDRTLLPGLIDAHIHLFLHPGAEGLQTVQESVPQRTIMATLAARDDLMAGFTAERDMGTEGAGPADTAVRDAIDRGQIPGPRLRISGNAIKLLGGHEDATGEPGALYAAQAGVASVDHAFQLSEATMRLMRQKHIFAVPTFTISEYFAAHAATPDAAKREQELLDLHAQEFRKQLAAGVSIALGSDVGPFPHGTQAREFVLMVKYGMSPLATLQADLINGAKLLEWEGQIGALKPGYLADIIAVPGNPLEDISALQHVDFVMKGGAVYKRQGP